MRVENQYYIYVITNKPYGTLYIGMTNDLVKRIYEHRVFEGNSFASKYKLDKLVYYEIFETANAALLREKQMKEWKRDWKINKIDAFNPYWSDLYDSICI